MSARERAPAQPASRPLDAADLELLDYVIVKAIEHAAKRKRARDRGGTG